MSFQRLTGLVRRERVARPSVMGNFGWFNAASITAAAENLTNHLVSKSASQTNATEEMGEWAKL